MNHNDERDFLEELANEADVRREQEAELAAEREVQPDDGDESTCSHCRRRIVWLYDAGQDRYGFWYDAEHGTESCGTYDDDADRFHRPLGANEDNGWPLAEDGDEDPRTFADIALHAGILAEEAGELSRRTTYPHLRDHRDLGYTVRDLGRAVERLAAQVSELAERLDRT